ncbi:RidA family protein [Kineococcus sp. LSe6-4]|uniref:RidA family protein n=1 Tax=Kineococcus halophytocola TaxID=3234027 RepID=A0ABV4H0Q3_9ACTN
MTVGPPEGRRAVDVDGFGHKNPLPAASRLGPLLVSSMVIGYDPGTTDVPPEPSAQVANLFHHVAAVLHAGGAGWEHVVRMTFYLPDLAQRTAVNEVWTATFPDAATRPARIAHEVAHPLGIRCEFIAYAPPPEETPC